MENQGDHGGTHAVEDRGQDGQAAEVNVKRAKRTHYDEVRQDERPSARPRSPEAAAQIGDENSDLDRERSRKRLAYRYAVAHLVATEPLSLLHELSLHLPTQCDWSAKADRAEARASLASSSLCTVQIPVISRSIPAVSGRSNLPSFRSMSWTISATGRRAGWLSFRRWSSTSKVQRSPSWVKSASNMSKRISRFSG